MNNWKVQLLKKYGMTDRSICLYNGVQFNTFLNDLELKFWRYWRDKQDVPKRHQQFLNTILFKIQ